MPQATAPISPHIKPPRKLTREHGFVLGVFKTHSLDIEFVFHAIRLEHGEFHDHLGDDVEKKTGQKMIGWTPIPCSNEAIQEMLSAERGAFDRKMNDLLVFVEGVVPDLADAEGPSRALNKLNDRIGNDNQSELPLEAPLAIRNCRWHLSEWVCGRIDSDEAAKKILGEFDL